MNKMLQNSQAVEVYDMQLQLLGRISLYTEDMYGHFTLIFSEIPKYELPEKVFLLPYDVDDLEKECFVSYLGALSGELIEKADSEIQEAYYIMEGTSEESDTLREDLRVFTSFPAEVTVDGHRRSIEVAVRDISVGGIMFVTDEKLSVGSRITMIFGSGKHEVTVKAVIKTQRPIHMKDRYGYGCKFEYLPPRIESEIRRVVFNEDIVQHHKGK